MHPGIEKGGEESNKTVFSDSEMSYCWFGKRKEPVEKKE